MAELSVLEAGKVEKSSNAAPSVLVPVGGVGQCHEHFYARYVSIKTFYSWKRSGARSIFLKEETQLESSYYFHTLLSRTMYALMSYRIFLKQESYDSTTFFVLAYQAKQMLPCHYQAGDSNRAQCYTFWHLALK